MRPASWGLIQRTGNSSSRGEHGQNINCTLAYLRELALKLLAFLAALFLPPAVSGQGILQPIMQQQPQGGGACGSGFAHCRSLAWDATQAGTADTSTFPGVVVATEADWAVTGSGGAVLHTVSQTGSSYTGTIPADFIFATDGAFAQLLWQDEEFDYHVPTTGAMIAWVNIGTLSHTTNTVIWACYGKSSITTQQNTVSSTWDSNFLGVWHYASHVATHRLYF